MATLTFTLRRLSTNAIGQTESVSDTVSLNAMLRVFGACEKMLAQIERDLAGQGAKPSEWRISDTSIGSFTLELDRQKITVDGHAPPPTEDILISSVNHLDTAQSVPPELPATALRAMATVAGSLRSRGVEHELLVSSRVTGAEGRISHPMAKQINQLLVKERVSLGTIEGRLELVSVHSGNRKFNVYHAVTGKAVECNIPNHLESAIIAAIKKPVLVSGSIHRNLNGDPVRVEVHQFRALELDHELLSLDELMGSLAGPHWGPQYRGIFEDGKRRQCHRLTLFIWIPRCIWPF